MTLLLSKLITILTTPFILKKVCVYLCKFTETIKNGTPGLRTNISFNIYNF